MFKLWGMNLIFIFCFPDRVYLGFDEKTNSPGSQKVQAVLALLSLQQDPMIEPDTNDQSLLRAGDVGQYLTTCNDTEILTAGPEGPAGPVSPSFPARPYLERIIEIINK